MMQVKRTEREFVPNKETLKEAHSEEDIREIIRTIEKEGKVNDFLLWSGSYNQNELFVSTSENVLHCWTLLGVIALVSIVVAIIALEFIDRDRR